MPWSPQCHITFRSNGPNFTHTGQDVWITGNVPQLGNWNPTHGLKLDGAAFPVWQAAIDLPQGAAIEYKATVVTSATGAVVWEGGLNRQIEIPSATACTKTFATDWRNP
jgi:alpha-amylase